MTSGTRPRGRPRASPLEARTHVVDVHLTLDEMRRLTLEAAHRGKRAAVVVREILLAALPPTATREDE